MKNRITLTKKEVQALIDSDDYIRGDFEKHHRHNGGYQEIIFPLNGKRWILTYQWYEDDGIYWDDNYDAFEVVEAEKVIKYWKLVDDGRPEPPAPAPISAPPGCRWGR